MQEQTKTSHKRHSQESKFASLLLNSPFPLPNILLPRRLFTLQLSFNPSCSKDKVLDGLNRTRLRKSLVDLSSLYWQILAYAAAVFIGCCSLKPPDYHQHKAETEGMQMGKSSLLSPGFTLGFSIRAFTYILLSPNGTWALCLLSGAFLQEL